MPDRIKSTAANILAFDFGLKRIGVAVGQTLTQSTQPLPLITAQDGAPKWQEIQTLIDEWQPKILVVGLPVHMDGTEQAMTKAATRFGNRLKGRFHLPVEWVDERLSSYEAEALLQELNFGHKKSTKSAISIDSVSAMLILQQWLNSYRPIKKTR